MTIKLKAPYIKLTAESRLYEMKIPVIGLTGGIATGKSSVSHWFSQKNIAIIDADLLVKEIYRLEETKKYIEKLSPASVDRNNGELKINFKKLREHFFSDTSLQNSIEQFIYPKLKEHFLLAFKRLESKQKNNVLIYDVPLLFERKLDPLFDVTICVYCPLSAQRERLQKRDHISAELADQILAKQMSIETKRQKSDLIIDNSGDLSALDNKCLEIFKNIFTYS